MEGLEKKNRGGAREGAGRKAAEFHKPTFAFRADADVAALLQDCKERSAVINEAVRCWFAGHE